MKFGKLDLFTWPKMNTDGKNNCCFVIQQQKIFSKSLRALNVGGLKITQVFFFSLRKNERRK